MAETEDPGLEHLRHMCRQLDRVENRRDDSTLRMDHVERSVAEYSVQLAAIDAGLDRLDSRVTVIEKRLDLVPG